LAPIIKRVTDVFSAIAFEALVVMVISVGVKIQELSSKWSLLDT